MVGVSEVGRCVSKYHELTRGLPLQSNVNLLYCTVPLATRKNHATHQLQLVGRQEQKIYVKTLRNVSDPPPSKYNANYP